MKKIEGISTFIMGIIWIIVGIILDFIIQLASTYSKQGVVNWLHVDRNNPLGIITMVVVTAILTILTVKILVYAVRKKSPKTGLHPFRADKLVWVGYGYLMILGAGLLTLALQTLITHQSMTASNQAELEEMAGKGGAALVFVVVLAVFVAPLVEELIFRGVVLNYFFKKGPWWLNVILSGLLFGYFHVFQEFQWFALLQYSLMGVALAIVYKKTKQIQYSMALHMLNNGIAAIGLINIALGA
ncbi:lysostaphin resistance A-like protein [Weissella bombi]|uniref:CPBP family intramembrane glutamic endopeptidase n=1 Tax=Weissella bombi TaxID=1505725 RepID=UPI003AF22085